MDSAFSHDELAPVSNSAVCVSQQVWTLTSCFSFAVDGVEVAGASKYGAVMDTGSSAIIVPRALYSHLPYSLISKGVCYEHFSLNMKL
jgi:hypothetical protein